MDRGWRKERFGARLGIRPSEVEPSTSEYLRVRSLCYQVAPEVPAPAREIHALLTAERLRVEAGF